MDILRWRTTLHPILSAALILILLAWLIVLYHRQKKLHSARRALLLLAPKVLVVILLIFSYFDPVWTVLQAGGKDRKVLILTDCSSSMQTPDSEQPRADRADKLARQLKSKLKSVIDTEQLAFDEDLRKSPPKNSDPKIIRTDIGQTLVTLSQRDDISDCLAVALITDGGDEVLQNMRLPDVPVYIAGVGTDPDQWDDLAIIDLDVPAVVEKNADLKIRADIAAYSASPGFLAAVRDITVRLEEADNGTYRTRDTKTVHVDTQRQTAEFLVPMLSTVGTTDYRITIDSVDGELSTLNNTRQFSVEVRDKTLSILFYAQQLGWDFSVIRRQLAQDPAIALTALFRITADRFIVQGERHPGDESLQQGFPADGETLAQYKCIIIGSFGADYWRNEQLTALEQYVQSGGAVVFLGGEHSFAQGGYADTPIAPLFPWSLSSPGTFETGAFPVSVPLAASRHAIVERVAELLAQSPTAQIDSINITDQPKPGAISLLNATVGTRQHSVVALQRYGKGHVLAIATNTLWKWSKTSETLDEAYGHFWRTAVRHMTDFQEGGRLLSIKWNADHYSPGQQAVVTIAIGGRYETGRLHLRARLDSGDKTVDIPVRQAPGRSNTFTAQIDFVERTNYNFQLEAFLGEELLESYEKTLAIAPRLNEGANLQLDHVFLDDLAKRTGARYFREQDADDMARIIRERILDQAQHVEIPLVNDRYVYIIVLLVILAAEWIIRRKMNLF